MSRYTKKGILIALLVGIALMLSPFFVKAAEKANPIIELTSVSGVKSACSYANGLFKEYSGFNTQFIKISGKTVTVNMLDYKKLKQSEKEEVMKATLEGIANSSSIKAMNKTRLYNFVARQDETVSSLVRQLSEDVSGDYAEAYDWFKPFASPLSTILAFLSMVIFALLTVTILWDISYLSLPLFRNWLDKDNGKKPFGVSNEAVSAIKEAEADSSSYKSTVSIYFKHKTGQLVIICICLLYLVSGKIYVLAGRFMDMFSGVITNLIK